ncbi:hypothetical protein AKJ62_00035 [candidate division MSBL1 archaeon SCGC-AAA259D14]|uniref:ArnR1-like winged helix-turn-helix domain-containing protein n=1 Tax=candidate division MSBL1 archaeon SCGC-AAA259D14 TaxID=1698261 RepID=A0A133U936_9EURY|nr:hypothetical protein AKJ62_00035 [candidate division MSBL1 archaeon SCGC-AAA259D14]
MKLNEDRWDILSDILEPIYENESCNFSKLEKEMNLPTQKLKKYIAFLSGERYLDTENENGKKQVTITGRGRVLFRIVNLREKPEKESEVLAEK